MNIQQAAESLREKLSDPEVFSVRVEDSHLVVDVTFIYRVAEVPEEWEGFRVKIGRRSCW